MVAIISLQKNGLSWGHSKIVFTETSVLAAAPLEQASMQLFSFLRNRSKGACVQNSAFSGMFAYAK